MKSRYAILLTAGTLLAVTACGSTVSSSSGTAQPSSGDNAAPVTATAQLGWTDDAGSEDSTAGDFYQKLPAGTTTNNGYLIENHSGDGGATWSYVYPAFRVTFENRTNQPVSVGAFTLILYNGSGQETGSDSFDCTDSPFDQVLGADQSMSADGTLPNELPPSSVRVQVANIGSGC